MVREEKVKWLICEIITTLRSVMFNDQMFDLF